MKLPTHLVPGGPRTGRILNCLLCTFSGATHLTVTVWSFWVYSRQLQGAHPKQYNILQKLFKIRRMYIFLLMPQQQRFLACVICVAYKYVYYNIGTTIIIIIIINIIIIVKRAHSQVWAISILNI